MKMKRAKNFEDLMNQTMPELKDEVMKAVAQRSFSMLLTRMRVTAGMTQRDMASFLGCTQSRISKLEMSANDHISIQDLLDYGKATGMGVLEGRPESSSKISLTYRIA